MNAKLDYILEELWVLAWGASVQRANLYRKSIKPDVEDTRLFREDLISYLASQVIPSYSKGGVSEEKHYKHIDELAAHANGVGEKVLGELGYKYGFAQKLLNLLLKYHWCLGAIPEPPHCPVDRIVIQKTRYKDKINWTQIVKKSEYQTIIENISVSQEHSLLQCGSFLTTADGRGGRL